MTDITQVSGIGPAAAGLLKTNGFSTAEDLAAATIETLGKVKGFGPARAANIIAAAKQLLAAPAPAAEKPAKAAPAKAAAAKAAPAKKEAAESAKKPKKAKKSKDEKDKKKKGGKKKDKKGKKKK